eukprot:Opistho-2@49384
MEEPDNVHEGGGEECGVTARAIRAIDARSVHQICSGQVVLTLANAVKELVENSLDAGATNIEVRLREYGSEAVEVIDNGSGIEPSDYEALTLKHYTSKIATFDDLTSVSTFGFRGEALSSLCALGKLAVVTRTAAQEAGVRLEFDSGGRIVSQAACPREKGTTVSIRDIFASLPVRHKEFTRNLKREFGKLVSLLHAYCLAVPAVKLSCTNHAGKGQQRSEVVSTRGNASVADVVTSLFGAKQSKQMEAVNVAASGSGPQFQVKGLVSRPLPGHGRSSADRQFFFINKRPCDMAKLAKVANEVYRSFNPSQYPVLVLELILPTDRYDVNVTPDKRTILLHDEGDIVESFKHYLEGIYEPSRGSLELTTDSLTHCLDSRK